MRIATLGCVVFASMGVACSSGGGDGNGAGGTAGTGGTAGSGGSGEPTAVSIGPSTAIPTAGASAAVTSFGAQFGAALTAAFEALAGASSASEAIGPKQLASLELIGFCDSGRAFADWNNADQSLAFTVGDTVGLRLEACAGSQLSNEAATGGLEVAITSASGGLPFGGGTLGGDGSVSITVASTPETSIDGTFDVDVNAPDLSIINLTLGDQQSSDELTVVQGARSINVSCFEIFQRIFPFGGTVAFFRPIATADVNNQWFTLNSYVFGEAPSIDFTGSVPTSGSLNTASGVSSEAPCFDGTPAGDGSFLTATFTGGGGVTLEGRDAEGNAFSCMTTWDDLLDLEFITSGEVCGETMPAQCMEPTGDTVVINDADFDDADWDSTVSRNPAEGATVNTEPTGRLASGGLADSAYRRMTHEIDNPEVGTDPGCTSADSCAYSIAVTHNLVRSGETYTPETEGALAYIDYSEAHIITEPAFEGAAVGWTFAVFQDGTRYIPDPAQRESTAFTDTVWTTEIICGLTEDDFIPDGLNLADGSELTFAYIRSNTNTSPGAISRNVHGIDNFEVVLVKAPTQ